MLKERGPDVLEAVGEWARQLDNTHPEFHRRRLEALWQYLAHDVVEAELLQSLLVCRDGGIRAAATRVIGDWSDRLPDPLALLAERIASSLGLPPPDSGNYSDAVIRNLADQNMLLVLDNLEHLLESTPFVQDLATTSPDLVIVITSRQRLAIPGEHVFEVLPRSSRWPPRLPRWRETTSSIKAWTSG